MIQETGLREWQTRREDADCDDRGRREKDARDFQEKQAKDARRHNWLTVLLSFVGISIAAYSAMKSKEPTTIIIKPPAEMQMNQPVPEVARKP